MERLLTLYSEVQSTDVRWLWYPFIAIGKLHCCRVILEMGNRL